MKERLTGAILLVVLVVALVPELLSGPKTAPAGQVATTADGAAIRSVSVDLTEPAAPVGAGAAATVPAAPPATSPAAPSATPAATPSPDSLAGSPAATGAAPASAPAVAPVTASAEVPTPDPIVRTPRAPAGHDSFVVQAGIFSNRANATRLAQELDSKGLAAQVSVVKHGASERYRVGIGAVVDRAVGTALLARARAAGFSALLVPAGS